MAKSSAENFMMSDEDALKIKDILEKNEQSVNYFVEIADGVVDKYCKFIDDLMNEIRGKVSNILYPITDDELNFYIMKLPNALYFCGEAVSALGVKADMAKADRISVYNTAQMDATGTVADKASRAESASRYESIIENIFNRAERKVKDRIGAGYEMLSSMKKVLGYRQMSYQLTGVQSGRIAPNNGYQNYKDKEEF